MASEQLSDPQSVCRSTGEVWLKHLCSWLIAEVFETSAFWWTNTESPVCATGVQIIVSFNFHQRTARVIIISGLQMKDWDQQRGRDFVETTQLLREAEGTLKLVWFSWLDALSQGGSQIKNIIGLGWWQASRQLGALFSIRWPFATSMSRDRSPAAWHQGISTDRHSLPNKSWTLNETKNKPSKHTKWSLLQGGSRKDKCSLVLTSGFSIFPATEEVCENRKFSAD